MATSLIPSGQTSFPYVGDKAVTLLSSVKSSDGSTWTSSVPTLNSVSNEFTQTLATGDIAFVFATTSNAIANIDTPKAIEQVSNYCKATNSHSIYKGNNITQVLGKVAVGNGDKGLVSKVVEDVSIVVADYLLTAGETLSRNLDSGEKVALVGFDDYPDYFIVQRMGVYTNLSYVFLTSYPFLSYVTNYWLPIGNNLATPTHSTIDLDNSDSPAIKYLSTIATNDDGELAYQILTQEVVYNETTSSYDGDDSEFTELSNGTITDLNGETAKTVVSTLNLGRFK